MISSNQNGVNRLVKVFTPVIDVQTYKSALYLLLAFPLGFIYSMVLGFGFIFGIGFSIIGFGLILLVLTLVLVRVFASFERWLSTVLLGIELDSPDDVVPAERIYKGIKALVDAGSTWQGLGFLTLKLWFGIIGLLLLFALLTTLSMIAVIVRRPHEIEFGELNGEPIVWTVETVPETGLAVALGLAGTMFLIHLNNAFAYVARKMSLTLLGGDCKR